MSQALTTTTTPAPRFRETVTQGQQRPLVFLPAQLPRVPKAKKTTTTTPTPDRALGSLVTLATLTDSDMEEGVPKESQSEEIKQKKLHAMMMKFIKTNGPKEDFRYSPVPNNGPEIFWGI